MDFFELPVVVQALIGGTICWLSTTLGAGLVVFFKEINTKTLKGMLGFSAGIMLAASFFSLLLPAIDQAEELGMTPWLVVSIGFMLGALFLYGADKILPHIHPVSNIQEGPKTELKRSTLLVLAITLHNIPEGLAVGVAFGAGTVLTGSTTFAAALALTLGIAIQDFPEGTSVALPLRADGNSRMKSFIYGSLSGIVEPISAVIGALLVIQIQSILPFALAFSAGAMIFVTIEELIPEAQDGKDHDFATIMTMFGFVLMMILDVALG